jgi:rod shape-determining protein MreC
MKRLHVILLGAAVVLAIVLLSFSAARMQAWQSGFLTASGPAIQAGSALSNKLSQLNRGLKTLDQLEVENAALALENNELKATQRLLGDLEEENRRLRAALEYRERSPFRLLPAKVLSRDASSWWSSLKINRGFDENISPQQAVLTAEGLVGRTTTVAKDLSIVMLLTDENCRVAARIEGTTEQGILTGRRVSGGAPPELVLSFLSRDAAIEPGMQVVTAGVSGAVFPGGIPLGTVKEFRARELDGQAIVTPAVDFARLEDVFVVLGTQ